MIFTLNLFWFLICFLQAAFSDQEPVSMFGVKKPEGHLLPASSPLKVRFDAAELLSEVEAAVEREAASFHKAAGGAAKFQRKGFKSFVV